jgi:hypothetical protein
VKIGEVEHRTQTGAVLRDIQKKIIKLYTKSIVVNDCHKSIESMGVNIGISGLEFRRQRSENQLSSSWSVTLGHLGQRIEEYILAPHPLQVCCCTIVKNFRHTAQLSSCSIKI